MYEYDAFFSYKRHRRHDDWHSELMQQIEYWVSLDLGKPNVNIFFDNNSIDNGHQFDSVIAGALSRSKVLISLRSPLYFASAYCKAELDTFIERERHLGKPTGALIACANFHDGETFPSPYATMQSENFSDFTSISGEHFWKSPKGLEFESKIKQFSMKVAAKIRSAPDWMDTFPRLIYDENNRSVLPRILRPIKYLATEMS